IGDINRFPTPHQLVGYAGLGAGVHSSGQEHYGGRITKQGRRDIRKTMVDVAWVAVANHFYWKAVFERLADRTGRNKAIVAIARKLLVVVWHVLAKQVADLQAVPERVAGKFLEWSWKVGRVDRLPARPNGGVEHESAIDNGVRAVEQDQHAQRIPGQMKARTP